MSTITNNQIKRGVSIAQQEGDLRWAWADLALEVAPQSEGRGVSNGRDRLLADLRQGVAEKGNIPLSDLPRIDSLRDYRDAAAAVPPEVRTGMGVIAARELGRNEPDKTKRLATIEQLRAEHPKGIVTVDAVRVYFDKVPSKVPSDRKKRIKNDLANGSHEERVRAAADLLNDPKVERELRQRNGRPKNWNGKTNATRERELKARKRENKDTVRPEAYVDLLRLQMEIARFARVLERWEPHLYDVDEPTLWLIADIHDDLVTLGEWHDRVLSSVQGWLLDVDVRQKIAKLRDTKGRTKEEADTALRLADRLERKLENRLSA